MLLHAPSFLFLLVFPLCVRFPLISLGTQATYLSGPSAVPRERQQCLMNPDPDLAGFDVYTSSPLLWAPLMAFLSWVLLPAVALQGAPWRPLHPARGAASMGVECQVPARVSPSVLPSFPGSHPLLSGTPASLCLMPQTRKTAAPYLDFSLPAQS